MTPVPIVLLLSATPEALDTSKKLSPTLVIVNAPLLAALKLDAVICIISPTAIVLVDIRGSVPVPSYRYLQTSVGAAGLLEGEIDGEIDGEYEGEIEGLIDDETELVGLADGLIDWLIDGDAELDGLIDGLIDAEGLTEGLIEDEGLAEGETDTST